MDHALAMDLADLKALLVSRKPGYVPEAGRVLARILERADPTSIRPLIRLLDDEPDHAELASAIVAAIESFERDTFLAELLPCLPDLQRRAPGWGATIMKGLLGLDAAVAALRLELVRADPEVRRAAQILMTEVARRSR